MSGFLARGAGLGVRVWRVEFVSTFWTMFCSLRICGSVGLEVRIGACCCGYQPRPLGRREQSMVWLVWAVGMQADHSHSKE